MSCWGVVRRKRVVIASWVVLVYASMPRFTNTSRYPLMGASGEASFAFTAELLGASAKMTMPPAGRVSGGQCGRLAVRACNEHCCRVLGEGVALAVQQLANHHDRDELAGLGQHLGGVAARCFRVGVGARVHPEEEHLMFFSASTPRAGPTVLLSAGSQKWRALELPFGGGRSSIHMADQQRHTAACATLRKTMWAKRCWSAPYLGGGVSGRSRGQRVDALPRRQLLLQVALREVGGVDARRAEKEAGNTAPASLSPLLLPPRLHLPAPTTHARPERRPAQ